MWAVGHVDNEIIAGRRSSNLRGESTQIYTINALCSDCREEVTPVDGIFKRWTRLQVKSIGSKSQRPYKKEKNEGGASFTIYIQPNEWHNLRKGHSTCSWDKTNHTHVLKFHLLYKPCKKTTFNIFQDCSSVLTRRSVHRHIQKNTSSHSIFYLETVLVKRDNSDDWDR